MVETLSEFLERTGIRQAELARQIDVSPAQVSFWLSGKRRPGLQSAIAIERFTKGAVPASSWLDGQKTPPPQ